MRPRTCMCGALCDLLAAEGCILHPFPVPEVHPCLTPVTALTSSSLIHVSGPTQPPFDHRFCNSSGRHVGNVRGVSFFFLNRMPRSIEPDHIPKRRPPRTPRRGLCPASAPAVTPFRAEGSARGIFEMDRRRSAAGGGPGVDAAPAAGVRADGCK
uniref:Uncharacterized protein n=1 Tax=Eutreptiella gymnastica TaxID=73025 RepID=A0A7S4G3H6_9EUGL